MKFDVTVNIRAVAHLDEDEQFDLLTGHGVIRVHTVERLGNHRVSLTGHPYLKTGALGVRNQTEIREINAVSQRMLAHIDNAVHAEVLRRTVEKINPAPMGA